MDKFREESVMRQKQGAYTLLYYLSWVLLVVCGILAVSGLSGVMNFFATGQFDVISLGVALLFGGAAYLLWRNKDELRAEYDYSFTNGDLDIAKVLNNSRRRYLTCLPIRTVEACGPVSASSFQRYITMPNVKKHNWFLNRECKLYYFYFTKNNVKHLIIAELSDEMIELIRSGSYLNFGVWQG